LCRLLASSLTSELIVHFLQTLKSMLGFMAVVLKVRHHTKECRWCGTWNVHLIKGRIFDL